MSDLAIFIIVCGAVGITYLMRHKKHLRIKGPGFDFYAEDTDSPEKPK